MLFHRCSHEFYPHLQSSTEEDIYIVSIILQSLSRTFVSEAGVLLYCNFHASAATIVHHSIESDSGSLCGPKTSSISVVKGHAAQAQQAALPHVPSPIYQIDRSWVRSRPLAMPTAIKRTRPGPAEFLSTITRSGPIDLQLIERVIAYPPKRLRPTFQWSRATPETTMPGGLSSD